MRITWLGHSSFRIEIGNQVLLIDPWLEANPSFPDDRRAEALAGATQILLTHGHGDHAGEAVAIAKDTGAGVTTMVEMAKILASQGVAATGFNKGGTVTLGDVQVTMVHAVHSSSVEGGAYAGGECGFMIAGEGKTIYVSGDTDVMADMAIFQDLHAPDIGLLCCGGHYTMDMRRAAYACTKFFDFKVVIPSHFGTFPALAPSAAPLRDALPDIDVRLPEVMAPIDL